MALERNMSTEKSSPADTKRAQRIREKLKNSKTLTEREEEFLKEYDTKNKTEGKTREAKNRVGRELIVNIAAGSMKNLLDTLEDTALKCGAQYTLWGVLKAEVENPMVYLADAVSDLIPESVRFRPKHELLALCVGQGAHTAWMVRVAGKTHGTVATQPIQSKDTTEETQNVEHDITEAEESR